MKNYLLLLLIISFISCKKEYIAENRIQEDVNYLANDKLEGRQTGTEGEKAAADYIAKRFKSLGLSAKGTDGYLQAFTFKPKTEPHQEITYTVIDGDSTVTGLNVIGYMDNKANNTVIIGAHYDHLGYGAEGSMHRGEKAIHNGADDNASGVAVLLNLIGKLKNSNPNNNYLFMAFSAEEMGLLGSNYFVKNPTINLDSTNYMMNMDMVGRLKKDSTLAVYGVGTSPYFKQIVASSNNNRFKIIENESGIGPSDHTSFYLADIPVLHFFTGQHKDYHRPGDDSEKLNYKGMSTIADYIYEIITDLDDNGKLAFRKTKNESEETPRFKVTLGVVPDYMYDGGGMRIDGVSEEKPAKIAGIEKGDIVIQMGDLEIKDMMGYMKALSSFKEGDKTIVKIKRGEETIEKEVTFK